MNGRPRPSLRTITFKCAAFSMLLASLANSANALPQPIAIASKDKMAATQSPQQVAFNGLKAMGEAIHRLKRASIDMVSECQQQSGLMGGEIDFIGTDVIPILPATAEGFGPASFLPPRKKYVDLHMQQMGSLIPILQDDIDAIQLPDDAVKAQTAADFKLIGELMNDIRARYKQLGTMTQAPPYENQPIADQSRMIHDDVQQIDKLRKKIYSAVKHDKPSGS